MSTFAHRLLLNGQTLHIPKVKVMCACVRVCATLPACIFICNNTVYKYRVCLFVDMIFHCCCCFYVSMLRFSVPQHMLTSCCVCKSLIGTTHFFLLSLVPSRSACTTRRVYVCTCISNLQ